jgi:hypothetical protein
MFMTPREIMTRYQPLEGDRHELADPRGGEVTQRSRNTGGMPNYRVRTNERSNLANIHGWGTDTKGEATHFRGDISGMETDEQLWARKLHESKMSPGEYWDQRHPDQERKPPEYEEIVERPSAPQLSYSAYDRAGTDTLEQNYMDLDEYAGKVIDKWRVHMETGPSLHDTMRTEGFQNIAHLSTQFGTQGKPMLAGTHHRLAALNDLTGAPREDFIGPPSPNRADQLIPVLHHASVNAAQEAHWEKPPEVKEGVITKAGVPRRDYPPHWKYT